jgi:hypothetical protein
MAFSNNYQIKLIETGLESGTWGTSTNNNLERIEQSLGQSVAINVEAPPTGSTVVTGPPYVFTWITSDTANVNVSGSEGRAKYVEFVSGGSLAENVTVEVRGNTAGILPNRFYLVRNSINTSSTAATLTLNAGAGSNYTIESGACALVVINGTSVVGGLTAGTALNAISNLQVDNLQFSASASDIKLPDNVASALEIKSTSANSEFLRFDTTSNHLEIAPGTAVNNIELHATDITTSTQATAVTIVDSVANALDVKTGSKSLVNLNTSTDTLTLSTNNIVLDDTDGTNLTVENGEVTALDVYQSGGANFIRLDTVNGTNSGGNVLHLLANQCDLLVSLGNKLQVATGAAIESYGSALFTTVDINGGTIDGAAIASSTIASSTIDSTPIGNTSANVGKFCSGSVLTPALVLGNLSGVGQDFSGLFLNRTQSYVSFGTTYGQEGIRYAGTKVEIKNTAGDTFGQPYHAGMVSGEGAFFESSVNLGSVASGGLVSDFSASQAHGLITNPKLLRAVIRCINASNAGGYAVGDEIPLDVLADTENSTVINDGVTYGANATNVFVHCNDLNEMNMVSSGGGTHVFVELAYWDIYVYAWK